MGVSVAINQKFKGSYPDTFPAINGIAPRGSLQVGVVGDIQEIREKSKSKNQIYIKDKIIYMDEEKIITYANSEQIDFTIKYDIYDYMYSEYYHDRDDFTGVLHDEGLRDSDGEKCEFSYETDIKEVLMVSYFRRLYSERDKLFIVHKLDEDDIFNSIVAPYPFGNVYSSGHLCWGSASSNHYSSIHDWFNMTHNSDLTYYIKDSAFDRLYDMIRDESWIWEDTAYEIVEDVNKFVEDGSSESLMIFNGELKKFI